MLSVAGLYGGPAPPPGFVRYGATSNVLTRLAEPGGGWDAQSIPYAQVPAVSSGYVLVTVPLSDPGSYVVTPFSDGILSLDTGGDNSRQFVLADIYDYKARAYYGAATFTINNQAPTGPPIGDISLIFNEFMTPRDLAAAFTDFEGDALTFAVSSGAPPAGTSVDEAGQWSGLPISLGGGSFNLTATDTYGATGTINVSWLVSLPSTDGGGGGDGDGADDEAIEEGGLSRRPRKRYYVEIDHQHFEVQSPSHARALLDQAREIARTHAQRLAEQRIPRTRKQGSKPVALPTPRIDSPNPELRAVVREARNKINAVYRETALDTELAMLFAQQLAHEREDEEESLLLLM